MAGLQANRGFTIIEIMAVLLIMLLLFAILTPTAQMIYRSVLRTASLATVHEIEGGCRQYKEQVGDFPASNHADYPVWRGSELLVLFLTGYGPDVGRDGTPGANVSTDDGCEGFGFRVEARGLVHGPYNGAEKIKTRQSTNGPVFIDSFDEEIYYYRYDALLLGYQSADNGAAGPIAMCGTAYAQDRKDFMLATRGPDGVFMAYDDDAETDDITNFLEEQ